MISQQSNHTYKIPARTAAICTPYTSIAQHGHKIFETYRDTAPRDIVSAARPQSPAQYALDYSVSHAHVIALCSSLLHVRIYAIRDAWRNIALSRRACNMYVNTCDNRMQYAMCRVEKNIACSCCKCIPFSPSAKWYVNGGCTSSAPLECAPLYCGALERWIRI